MGAAGAGQKESRRSSQGVRSASRSASTGHGACAWQWLTTEAPKKTATLEWGCAAMTILAAPSFCAWSTMTAPTVLGSSDAFLFWIVCFVWCGHWGVSSRRVVLAQQSGGETKTTAKHLDDVGDDLAHARRGQPVQKAALQHRALGAALGLGVGLVWFFFFTVLCVLRRRRGWRSTAARPDAPHHSTRQGGSNDPQTTIPK